MSVAPPNDIATVGRVVDRETGEITRFKTPLSPEIERLLRKYRLGADDLRRIALSAVNRGWSRADYEGRLKGHRLPNPQEFYPGEFTDPARDAWHAAEEFVTQSPAVRQGARQQRLRQHAAALRQNPRRPAGATSRQWKNAAVIEITLVEWCANSPDGLYRGGQLKLQEMTGHCLTSIRNSLALLVRLGRLKCVAKPHPGNSPTATGAYRPVVPRDVDKRPLPAEPFEVPIVDVLASDVFTSAGLGGNALRLALLEVTGGARPAEAEAEILGLQTATLRRLQSAAERAGLRAADGRWTLTEDSLRAAERLLGTVGDRERLRERIARERAAQAFRLAAWGEQQRRREAAFRPRVVRGSVAYDLVAPEPSAPYLLAA